MIIMKIKKKKKADIFIRIDPELKHRLDQMKNDKGCTRTALITSMIEHSLNDLEKQEINA